MTTKDEKSIKKNKIPLYDEYFNIHNKYDNIYGKNRCVVLMQNGSFYEIYSTDNNEGCDIKEVCSLLNIVCTRKDKSNPVISRNNSYMAGFPIAALEKFVQILMNNQYTVIQMDQHENIVKKSNGEDKKEFSRTITHIYSPGTAIDYIQSNDINNIVCIYVEQEKQMNGKFIPCIGLSSIDLSTGK